MRWLFADIGSMWSKLLSLSTRYMCVGLRNSSEVHLNCNIVAIESKMIAVEQSVLARARLLLLSAGL